MKNNTLLFMSISFSLLLNYYLNPNVSYDGPFVDFDKGMLKPFQMGHYDPNDHVWLKFLRELYRKNNLSVMKPAEEPRIPKIIHQIWLGSPVPDKYKVLMDSWKKMHPDWQYILWTDKEVASLKLYNQDLFDRSRNYGQRSDIVRYEVLYQYGGLYADTDFRCLKKFDIFHHCYDFYVGIPLICVELANGLIGAAPGHPILQELIIKMKANWQKYSPGNILNATGPGWLTRCFMKIAPSCNGSIIAFPNIFFFPISDSERILSYNVQDLYIKPESFAIHYFACSWYKPQAFVYQ